MRQQPRRRAHARVGLLGVAFLLIACGGNTDTTQGKRTPAPAATTSNAGADLQPVITENFPDPDILRVGNTYYAYATQRTDRTANISMARSTDFTTWQLVRKDPLPAVPTWATINYTWAPEVTAIGGAFVMYPTMRSIDHAVQCIGVARATSPEGPFEPVGAQPLVCPKDEGGAIDAASFRDSDGKRYLLWKNDGNCCNKDTWLYLQELAPDGLSLVGRPTRLIKQTEDWEGSLIEAPALVRRGSTYVLFYSANDFGGDTYATGYATARKVTGPYTKAEEPLMTTDSIGVAGPGGADVVELPGGRMRIVFHGWDAAIVTRGMYVADLSWDGDRPVVKPPS